MKPYPRNKAKKAAPKKAVKKASAKSEPKKAPSTLFGHMIKHNPKAHGLRNPFKKSSIISINVDYSQSLFDHDKWSAYGNIKFKNVILKVIKNLKN
jgi:hypothetical protein